ncbi:MAG: class I SAM-dependent methyltransferase [Candidatus Omnitrophota bacterium]|nr:class I SAM-dependent methyltransferase [Candidatus Omnitrophota bacterium]
MERVNCNLCGRNDTQTLFKTQDRAWLVEGSFNLVKCLNCGLIYLNPRPDAVEMSKYYPPPYFSRVIADGRLSVGDESLMKRDFKLRLKEIVRYKNGGRFLDIGCLDGYFLAYLKKIGWQVSGVEIDSTACRFARDKLGLEVFCGELIQAAYPERYFDVISLYDVLEHLSNPSAALREIYRILKDDGLLCIRVPNIDSLEFRIFKERWLAIDAPRHLFHFQTRTIKKILEKCGFKYSKITSSSLRAERIWGYKESLRYLLMEHKWYVPKSYKDSPGQALQYKKPLWKIIVNYLELLIFFPISILADCLRKGNNLMVYAGKAKES